MLEKKKLLKFKSTEENVHLVEEFVDVISDQYNINNTYFGNIVIALTEAVNNAMVHGNGNNNEKFVVVRFESKPQGLSFTVTDEGEGFDFNRIPDPTDITHEHAHEGRGIFLIKSLADQVNFMNNGNSIEFIFNVANINAELAAERINQLNEYSGTNVRKKVN